MKRNGLMALLGIVAGLAVLAAVGIVAYNFGLNTGDNGGHTVFGPMMRGYHDGNFGMGAGTGWWWWAIIPVLLLGFVVIWLFAAILAGPRRDTPATAPGPSGDSVERLRELTEMHDRGALTDDEFAAAKRKLLGL
ncbi:MAG: SHOCT domain-containing protein [Candidatus Limnocylindrales bacterium]